jgi:hypothetical protein
MGMNQIRPGASGPAAVLAGSLAVFPLLDVLRLLGRTKHAGELHIVGDGVEASLWVDEGELLDHPATATVRLFELACLGDAWFTVTASPAPDRPANERLALEALVDEVEPQVDEWHGLVGAVPFEAVVKMAPTMPGPGVQIRSDQWRVLSLVGAGRPVHEVIDVADASPLETLRLVYELAESELISVEVPEPEARPRAGRTRKAAEAERDRSDDDGQAEEAPAPPRALPVRSGSTASLGLRRQSGATVAVPPADDDGEGVDQPMGAHVAHRVQARSLRPRAAAYMPPPVPPDAWPSPVGVAAGGART